MERMTKGEGMTPEEYMAMVEESDARVYKSQMNAYKEKYLALLKANTELEEENKRLNDKIEHLEFDIEAWKKLKAIWEKKEQKLQIEIGGLMGERDGLKMVVEKLHKELDECECSMHFENDEVGYRKRECKNLKEDNKRLREGVDAGQKLVEDLISKNKKLEKDLAETQKIGESRRQECKQLRKFSDFGGYGDE